MHLWNQELIDMSQGRQFLERFLESFRRQDADELMAYYHEDAELIAFDFALKGADAIGHFFAEKLLKNSGKILGFATEAYFETDDVILFTMIVDSEDAGKIIARDALCLRDGKISGR